MAESQLSLFLYLALNINNNVRKSIRIEREKKKILERDSLVQEIRQISKLVFTVDS